MQPYESSERHLWDELSRIDALVRAQVMRWRATTASMKPESLWGMVHVSHEEVEAYLGSVFAPPHELPPEAERIISPFRDHAERRRQEIDARVAVTGSALRAVRLRQIFGLSPLEHDIVLACLLPELDERYRRLFGYLQDDASRTAPSVGLIEQLLLPVSGAPTAVRAAFEPGAALRRECLVVIAGDGGSPDPLPVRAVRLDDRVAAHLLGSDALDGRLDGVVRTVDGALGAKGLVAEGDHVASVRRLGAWLREEERLQVLDAVVFLRGPRGVGRRTSVRTMCAAAGVALLEADAAAALASREGFEAAVALGFREARLRDAAILWRNCDALLDDAAPSGLWESLLDAAERFQGLTALAAEKPWDPAGRFRQKPFVRLDLRSPGFTLRRALWEDQLGDADAGDPSERDTLSELLANSFQLTAGQIADSMATARGLALERDPANPRPRAGDLAEACRRQSARRLVSFTRRIEPRTELSFDDLVLPSANLRQLRELRDRIANRGRVHAELGFDGRMPLSRGLIALFTGSSGTGKTMAAELLAREQGVDLYKVDLSAVVSKYVGETEKNLSRVFGEAEGSNAIVLFDECESIFGKRGEVHDARDRWANMEVTYLLQRIEEYAGVVILASNLRQNIDEAFTRRIAVVVEFPFPDADARARIICGMFPAGVERPADEDLQSLADRFRLSGGSNRNVVIDAAFRAVAEDPDQPRITLRHLVLATAREYQKLGKPITKGEFGEELYPLVEEDLVAGAAA